MTELKEFSVKTSARDYRVFSISIVGALKKVIALGLVTEIEILSVAVEEKLFVVKVE